MVFPSRYDGKVDWDVKQLYKLNIYCLYVSGNHADTAMELLRKSGLPIIVANGMNEAAKLVVESLPKS